VFAHIRAGEQRPATVLMTDISGFTALGEAAEPEWLFHLINEVFEELVDVLIAHGAHIDKYVGDEVVAVFGVPYAQEKAVERALRAALAMRERLRALNAEGRFGGTAPGIHTGINVGPVMVGPVGHRDHADYTIIGDTVNVAKRLEDEAPAGEIFVTEAVRQAAGGEFEFAPMGELHLSGRGQAVAAYRLVGTAQAGAAAPPRSTASVSRTAEFGQISAAAAGARAGRQTSLFILGGIGIGKSHLLHEWSRLEGASFQQVRTRCHVFGAHFPLLPVVDLVAQLLGLRLESWPPRVAGNVAEALRGVPLEPDMRARLAEALGVLQSPPPDRPQWLEELAAAMAALLDCRSGEAPLCLVIEDGHWLDETSRVVLSEVLSQPASRPVLALVTTREPPDNWPPESIGALTVSLAPLPRAAMEELTAAWAAPRALSPEMVRAVCDRAQGHPYFARELVHALSRQPDLDSHGELRLPASLQELFLSQLDALDLPVRQLVQAAAVVGEPLSHELLQTAMEGEEQFSPALVGQALSEGLLGMGAAPGQFVFERPMLFEAAYSTIPGSKRKALHARLAEHLLHRHEVFGSAGVHLAAHHAYLGYSDERALASLLESARLYREQYASRQIVQTAGRVLEIIGALTDARVRVNERLEALLLLAQTYQVLGDLGHAEGTVAEAEALAADGADAELVARIALTAATLHLMQGDNGAALSAFTAAQRAWEQLDNEPRAAHALLGQGMCARQLGRDEEALDLFTQAAQRCADALWVKAAARNNAGIILMGEGRYAEAEPYLTEGLQANEQDGDRRGMAHSQASLGELCLRRGQLAAALRWLREALKLAREIEDANCRVMSAVLLSRVQALSGDLAQAEATLAEHVAESNDDPELALSMRAAACDLALQKALAGQAAAPPPPCPVATEDGACLNACVDEQCLRLELALLTCDAGATAALVRDLTGHAATAPDHHLQAYAAWLTALAAQPDPRETGPFQSTEDTVFGLRAQRLLRGIAARRAQ
jgi:class 3 adenylate cyclase/tetratricopeptide (TPR) repeat protein